MHAHHTHTRTANVTSTFNCSWCCCRCCCWRCCCCCCRCLSRNVIRAAMRVHWLPPKCACVYLCVCMCESFGAFHTYVHTADCPFALFSLLFTTATTTTKAATTTNHGSHINMPPRVQFAPAATSKSLNFNDKDSIVEHCTWLNRVPIRESAHELLQATRTLQQLQHNSPERDKERATLIELLWVPHYPLSPATPRLVAPRRAENFQAMREC